ncbi:MAG: hypothetical protein JWM50_1597 [Microbacteriaceae bacterium]|jgi:PKD repeat protein|nr:hypothetical protein [Microbacteriaceae bacterium]
MVPTRSNHNRILCCLALGGLLGASFTSVESSWADTAPTAQVPQTVSADSLPTAQINGVVWDQQIVGDTVFVAGNFTRARPAGAPSGSSEVVRSHLLSYSLSTGALTNWAPAVNGQVRAMDSSPDGSRLYAVGAFTTVNGVAHNRVVAFDTASGAVDGNFSASANGEVFAVTASASTVFFAGNFSQAAGVSRGGHAAAASVATGAITPWAPVLAGGRAYGMEVSPDGSKVVIAGSFTSLNDSTNPGYGMGAVTATAGSNLPWAANSQIRNAGSESAVYGLSSDGDSVYGSGYIFGTGGNTEGTFRMSWNDGTLLWVADCRGDNYSAASQGGAVYVAGHSHQCQWIGGFPQNEPLINMRGLAYAKEPAGTVRQDLQSGMPATQQLAFFPNINAGSFTGQYQGAWTVQTNSQYVLFAGEFTQVNGVGQQGLSRFAIPAIAPNRQGPQLSGGNWPLTTASDSASTVRLSWPANTDRDSEQLTYRVIRNGNTALPVYTTTGSSRFWDQPTLAWVDTGRSPGTAYSYRVSATDAFGNVAWTNTISQTTATSGTYSPYAIAVTTDSPTFYYRLGESAGTTVTNHLGPVGNATQTVSTIRAVNGTAGSGVSRGIQGAIAGDSNTASRFNGTDEGRIATSPDVYSDDSMSIETWFSTTSASGKMIGFGSSSAVTGNSSTIDQSLYLSGGRVSWSVYDSAMRTIQSPASYADGVWHHAVATVGPDGMKLYVDGSLVATRDSTTYARGFWGYWKIGGDSTPAGNANFAGDLDEVAVYKTVLPASKVAQHFQLGTGGAVNLPPTASLTTAVDGLSISADGSSSTDTDGAITSWAWSWGDGSASAGRTASHSYAAAGTYTVRLTVTDDDGATGSTSRSVAVTGGGTGGPTPLASDTFERQSTSGWGNAQIGGTWAGAIGTNFVVNGGSGAALHTASATRRSLLSAISTLSADVSVKISVDKLTTGGGVSAGAIGRQGTSGFYQGRLRFLPDATVGLQLLSSSSTVLANTTIPGLTYLPGSAIALRVQVTGTNPTSLRAKTWAAGGAEPAAWQLTATDATAALQSAGSVGLEGYLSSGATNGPITVRYDDFSAATVQ